MATAVVSGTATKRLVAGVGVSGTAQASSSGFPADLTGTASVSYAVIEAWVATDKGSAVVVKLGSESVRGLLGAVSIEESTSTLVRTASFTVVDPRACFMAKGSLVRGAVPVKVYLSARTLASENEWLAFTGTVEGVSTDDPYCPKASIRAVSDSAALYARSTAGCVRLPPFAGSTRADILTRFAESVGVVMDLSKLPSGTVVRQPVDLSGITIEQLLLRYAELEGWYPREGDDGRLEFVTEQEVLNGPVKWNLTESNYLSLREDLPNRPVTVYSLGGAQIGDAVTSMEPPTSETDAREWVDSEGVRRGTFDSTTSTNGLLTQTIHEEWASVPINGLVPTAPFWHCIRRDTTTYVYPLVDTGEAAVTGAGRTKSGETVSGTFAQSWWDSNIESGYAVTTGTFKVPSGQLTSMTVVTEAYFASISEVGHGYAWPDNTNRAWTQELFVEIGRTTINQEWASPTDKAPCRLTRYRKTTTAMYNPLRSSSWLFADGKRRMLNWVGTPTLVSEYEATYSDNRAAVEAGTTSERRVSTNITERGYAITGYEDFSGTLCPNENYGTTHTLSETRVGVANAGFHHLVRSEWNIDGTASSSRTRENGNVPEPEVSSAEVPAYSIVPMTYVLVAWTNTFPVVTKTETTVDAEALWELKRVARRRTRSGLGLRLAITAPMVRGIKPWTIVAVTDRARGLDRARGWVERIVRTADSLNGWLGMELTVVVFPAGV